MPKTQTEQWLDQVCSHLCWQRHRNTIRQELSPHLDDRMRMLRLQGLTEEETERQAVLSMGDPDELGRALAELYRPMRRFFLWLVTVLLWAGAAILALCLLFYLTQKGR